MSKKTLLVIWGSAFCAIAVSLGVMTRVKDEDILNQLAEERSAESTVPFEEQLTFFEDDYVQKYFPKELIEYLGNSLREENLTECLLCIPAEYEVLSDKEKIKLIKKSSNNTLASYQSGI